MHAIINKLKHALLQASYLHFETYMHIKLQKCI